MVKLLDRKVCIKYGTCAFYSDFYPASCTGLDLGPGLGVCLGVRVSALGVIMVTVRPSVEFILG